MWVLTGKSTCTYKIPTNIPTISYKCTHTISSKYTYKISTNAPLQFPTNVLTISYKCTYNFLQMYLQFPANVLTIYNKCTYNFLLNFPLIKLFTCIWGNPQLASQTGARRACGSAWNGCRWECPEFCRESRRRSRGRKDVEHRGPGIVSSKRQKL